ncbi:MAG: mechanosensitive ion channel family protein [Ignavibacteria bacterium]|jgi:small conductance mechanosensitive channel
MLEKFKNVDFLNEVIVKGTDWIISFIPSVLLTIVLLIVSLKLLKFFTNRIKDFIIKRSQQNQEANKDETEKRINTLMGIIHTTGKISIWIVFMMIILREIGIDIGPILAGAGIIGIAVGFGSQELVKNIFSGFFILLDNRIRTGDTAVINGISGLVENVELRTTTLRDISGTVHIFENGKINTLSNKTKEWSATVFDIGIAYKEDVNKVIDIMKNVGDEMMNDSEQRDKILQPIEIFGLDRFEDSSVIIKARIKTKPSKQWEIDREYKKRLKYEFDKKGISMPFPQRTINWDEKTNPLKLQVEEFKKN